MAEKNARSPGNEKPRLPPKPAVCMTSKLNQSTQHPRGKHKTCSTDESHRNACKEQHKNSNPDDFSPKKNSNGNLKSVMSTNVTIQNNSKYSVKSVDKPSPVKCRNLKPELLPKPILENTILPKHSQCLHNKGMVISKSYFETSLNASKGSLSSTKIYPSDKRIAPKLSSFLKAPCANWDEFDNSAENPVRPPRSPKVKILTEEPFAKICNDFSSQKHLFPRNCKEITENNVCQCSDKSEKLRKSCSLSRSQNISTFGIKAKSASLGKSFISVRKDLLEQKISCPVPPPRRRRLSSAESDLCSKQLPSESSFFKCENEEYSYNPVYSVVNYHMKKNRRIKQEDISSGNVSENILLNNDPLSIDNCCLETQCSENYHQIDNEFSARKLAESESELSISTKNSEGCSSEVNFRDNIQNILKTECKNEAAQQESVISVHSCNNLGSNVIPFEEIVKSTESVESPINERECNDSHLSVDGREDFQDKHELSSSDSKLEWHSVKSSFCSSSSDIHEDTEYYLKRNMKEQVQSREVMSNLLLVNDFNDLTVESYDKLSCEFERQVSNESIKKELCLSGSLQLQQPEHFNKQASSDSSVLQCQDNKSLSNNTSLSETLPVIGEPEGDDFLYKSHPGICHRGSFQHTSSRSLPGRYKSIEIKKCLGRRQSWSCCKDDLSVIKSKQVGPVWVDEGEPSSGALGDTDSSDNAGRQSSLDELDGPRTSRFGKKFLPWWSSFGKGKKNRNKRQSQFYCEQASSSENEKHSDASKAESYEEFAECLSKSSGVLFESDREAKNSDCSVSIQINTEYSEPGKLNSSNAFCLENEQHSDAEETDANCIYKRHLSQSDKPKKAFFIAKELMTSERTFVDVLKLLNVEFRNAVKQANLKQSRAVIPEDDFSKLLNILPQLQRLNEDLLSDLEERIKNWSTCPKIADVIVRKGPFLKLYTTYIQNFESQCNFFDECCEKYPKFSKIVKEFEALPQSQKLSIKHFMLKPVQRIPQYRLLLDDYAHHIEPGSADYVDTETALRIVSDVADHANRSMTIGDDFSKLLRLQSQLKNYEIIKPGRVLLKAGELLKLSRKERHPRYFILLNDCLLYTSYIGTSAVNGLKVNAELSLGGMKVSTPQAEDYHNEFSIISSTRSFSVSARSLQERQDWVYSLQNSIKEYTSRQLTFLNQKLNIEKTDFASEQQFNLGKEAPVWIQDGRVTKCQLCVAEFTVTFRRHHCRACGKVICGPCSEFRAPLQYKKFATDRVCSKCYDALQTEFESKKDIILEVIKSELCNKNEEVDQKYDYLKNQFKKTSQGSGKKTKKYVPQRLLEVTANDTGSQMSGWLRRRSKHSWKTFWFVLKERVLYVYKASEDIAAFETIPVLGYKVEKKMHFQLYEGIDAKFVFQLTHEGQQPLIFAADNEQAVDRWMAVLQKATVLI